MHNNNTQMNDHESIKTLCQGTGHLYSSILPGIKAGNLIMYTPTVMSESIITFQVIYLWFQKEDN